MTGGKRRKKPSMESFELKVQLVAHPVGFATDRLIVHSRKSDGIITYHLHHETGEAVFDASR